MFPHDTTVPSSNNAEALLDPTAMSIAFVNLFLPSGANTCVGSVLVVVSPTPNLPLLLFPHDHTLPSCFSATVKLPPDIIFSSTFPK